MSLKPFVAKNQKQNITIIYIKHTRRKKSKKLRVTENDVDERGGLSGVAGDNLANARAHVSVRPGNQESV